MSLHHHHFPLTYLFQNRELNELYLSYAIYNFASALITIFVPIYFYGLGYSLIKIILFFVLMSASAVFFAWPGTLIVSRLGIKKSMFLSIPLTIAYIFGLRFIPDLPILFYILPILAGFKNTFFNYSLHWDFLANSRQESRGRQISFLQTVALIGACLAPLAGGLIAGLFGWENLFLAGAVCFLLSLIPLFFSPEIRILPDFGFRRLIRELAPARNWPQKASFAGYAIESTIGGVIWPVFLFLIFAEIELVGYLNALTALLTLMALYLIGRKTDFGNKRKIIRWSTGFYAASLFSRLFINGFFSATLVEIFRSLAGHAVHVPWDAYNYQLAAAKNPLLFIVSRDMVYNLARVIFVPFIALIFFIGFHPFLIAFALAALFSLFYAAITKNPPETDKTPAAQDIF